MRKVCVCARAYEQLIVDAMQDAVRVVVGEVWGEVWSGRGERGGGGRWTGVCGIALW